jgi:hypothetical protein
VTKIVLSASRDIPLNKPVLSQANVRRIKAGVSVAKLAEDIARRGLLQSLGRSIPSRPGPDRPAPRSRLTLGSDRVGDTLLGEARLGCTRELLLRRRTPAGLRGVALALLHEARQGRPGEFLVRRLSLAGCLRRKRAGGR